MTIANKEDLEFEEFHRANTLIAKKQYHEAEELLNLGLKKAKEKGSTNEISFYFFSLGHLYTIQKKHSAALNFYEQAYRTSDDFYTKLNYARLLISIYKNYDLSLKVVRDALNLIPPKHQALNEAHSIIGLCFLQKNDKANAIKAFNDSLSVDFDQFRTSESFDLTLVSELINQKVYNESIDKYLAYILKRATEENNTRLVKTLYQLLAQKNES